MKRLLRAIVIMTFIGSMCIFNTSIIEAKELKPSGFLEDYSGFTESEETKGLYVKRNQDRNIGEYSKFIIDPITVYFAPRKGLSKINPKRVGINPKRLAELTAFFEEEIVRTLSENYTVVDEPGEGVLRLKIAVTDVKANLPLLNIHMYSSTTGIGLGSASMEGEAVDSATGEQILAVVDSRKGKVVPKLKGEEVDDIAKEAMDNKLDSLLKYETIRQIMTNWAERFTAKVDELHVK
jgi:hypothetical protein